MKVMMIFDQTQAGMGGKESPDLPMGGKTMAIGSCEMFTKFLSEYDGEVIATLYCGDGTFLADPEKYAKKFAAMAKKFNPDVVICGPCFNYANYGLMAAESALVINQHTSIPAFAIMSQECEKAIAEYKDKVTILKMPKKGGIGLNESLQEMCKFARMLVDKEDTSSFIKEHAYC